jgi:hypothetical protein
MWQMWQLAAAACTFRLSRPLMWQLAAAACSFRLSRPLMWQLASACRGHLCGGTFIISMCNRNNTTTTQQHNHTPTTTPQQHNTTLATVAPPFPLIAAMYVAHCRVRLLRQPAVAAACRFRLSRPQKWQLASACRGHRCGGTSIISMCNRNTTTTIQQHHNTTPQQHNTTVTKVLSIYQSDGNTTTTIQQQHNTTVAKVLSIN